VKINSFIVPIRASKYFGCILYIGGMQRRRTGSGSVYFPISRDTGEDLWVIRPERMLEMDGKRRKLEMGEDEQDGDTAKKEKKSSRVDPQPQVAPVDTIWNYTESWSCAGTFVYSSIVGVAGFRS
jgi:hypothetical protein